MDWTSIITQLIETGGIVGILGFFLTSTEKKANAQLVNMQRMYDNLMGLYDKLQTRFDTETDKVGKLYSEIGDLHNKLDAANTKAATNALKRCDCLTCTKRQPPMSDEWRMDMDGDGKEES